MAIVAYEKGKMLDNTWYDYLFIRVVILFLQSIGPVSFAWTLTTATRSLYHSTWPQVTILRLWCAVESLWLVFFSLYRMSLQREAMHPPLRSRDQRQELFKRIRTQINDPEKFLSGWFRGADVNEIGRDELKLFLDWALWEGRAGEANEKELEDYAQEVEQMMGKKLKEGRGKARSLRLTLDPVEVDCRSLFWYMVIMLVDTVTHIKLRRYGMKYYSTVATAFGVFPPRPAAYMTTAKSPASRIAYWLRPHISKTRLPIVYIHGIGIGLYPNVEFLHDLDVALNSGPTDGESDGEVGVLAVEILPVSSRLTHNMLRRQEFLDQLTKILDAHGYDKFVLASHSYGSVLSTNILAHEPLQCRVAATFFIDPVTILLHMPDVAYNFTARRPRYANEWQLWYFASKDPGVAHTLGRHFFWSENLLWREHITELAAKGMRVTASLASRDLIVDTQAVGSYLADCNIPDPVITEDRKGKRRMQLNPQTNTSKEEWKHGKWTGDGLEVIWWEGLDHAQVFDTASRRAQLVKVLEHYSRAA